MAYERGRTGADFAQREARQAADRQRDDVRELMQRQAGRVEAERFARAAQAQQAAQAMRQQRIDQETAVEAERFARAEQARVMRQPYEVSMPGDSFLSSRVNQLISRYGQPVYAGGNVVGATAPVALPGILGGVADFFGVQPKAYTGISRFDPFDVGREDRLARDGRPDVVQPVADITGQQRCPDGYEFDANLNACRKITPSDFSQVAMTPTAVEPDGRYARMGLLDQPPAGLLEAGFGSPVDFTARNLAYRRAAASVPSYFTDPRSYEGYTLI